MVSWFSLTFSQLPAAKAQGGEGTGPRSHSTVPEELVLEPDRLCSEQAREIRPGTGHRGCLYSLTGATSEPRGGGSCLVGRETYKQTMTSLRDSGCDGGVEAQHGPALGRGG